MQRMLRKSSPSSLRVCAVAALAVVSAASAQAAKLTLANGDQVSGEIIRLKDQTLNLKSPLFGEVKIPWAQVRELRSDDGVRIQLADGSQLKGTLVLQPDGQVTVAEGPEQPARTLARNDVAMLNPPVQDNSTKYSGHATVGGTFNRGNSRDDAVNIDAELVARAPTNRYTLNAESHEAKSSGLTTTSNRMLAGQYDKFLNDKDYLFANLKAQTDKQADLNLRSTVGAGYGRQFVENELTKLSAETGLSYVNENYDLAPNKSFPAATFGLKYEQKLFDSKLVLFNQTDVTVSLSNTQDALLKNKFGFRVPIANGLNLSTQLNLAYDKSPPPGVKRTDTSLVVGVGYAF
jgi:putative salt-induced outer membrane protein YdiY